MSPLFRVFVSATDTGVGKTETSCALLSLLKDQGLSPVGFKPYESGCADLMAPSDASAHKQASGQIESLDETSLHRFVLPLAPGVAAARMGVEPDFQKTLSAFHRFNNRHLVVEGAGGLLVPLDSKRFVIDLAVALNLPVLLVAKASLGTLNHTGLSLEALAKRNLKVLGVVVSASTPLGDESEKDNAQWLSSKYKIPVFGPIPYTQNAAKRRELFKRTLAPILKEFFL